MLYFSHSAKKDGHQDLVVACNIGNVVQYYRGVGDGTFVSYDTYPSSNSRYLAVGSFNRGGKPDTVIARNFATNQFTALVSTYSSSIVSSIANGASTTLHIHIMNGNNFNMNFVNFTDVLPTELTAQTG